MRTVITGKNNLYKITAVKYGIKNKNNYFIINFLSIFIYDIKYTFDKRLKIRKVKNLILIKIFIFKLYIFYFILTISFSLEDYIVPINHYILVFTISNSRLHNHNFLLYKYFY